MLGAILQGMIKGVVKNPKLFGDDLEKFLADRQEAINEFLTGETLQGAPFFKEELIFKIIETVALELQEHLKTNGKNVPLEHLFQLSGFQAEIVTNLAKTLIEKAEGVNREKYVQDALAGPLVAKGATEKMARTIIEDSVEKAYYQAKIKKALHAYREHRWGK